MATKQRIEHLVDEIQATVKQLDDEDVSNRAALKAAVVKLERALESPAEAILRQRFHTVENLCIIAAQEIGLFEVLSSEGKETGWTVFDLAEVTGYDPTMIARIMRVITAIGFAEEIDHRQYRANAITKLQNSPGARGGFVLTNDFMFALAGHIREYFKQLKPCKPDETVPAYDFATKESIWKTLSERAEWKTGFDNAMRSRQKLFSTPWHIKFPLVEHLASEGLRRGDSSHKSTIVDIGGNQGVDLQRIVDAYPQLNCRLILQDLPETIKGIPSGSLSDRVEQTSYDFFTPQPVIAASIYYLKSVLHDWDDSAGRRILSSTAKAMDGDSRILINDIVLADMNERIDRANMDMLMLFISNGMERSQAEWVELLASVSPPLEIVKIWTLPEDPQSIIEARLVRTNH